MSSQRHDFFMSNPVKNCFLIETFLYENKILRRHKFLLSKTHFYKSKSIAQFVQRLQLLYKQKSVWNVIFSLKIISVGWFGTACTARWLKTLSLEAFSKRRISDSWRMMTRDRHFGPVHLRNIPKIPLTLTC